MSILYLLLIPIEFLDYIKNVHDFLALKKSPLLLLKRRNNLTVVGLKFIFYNVLVS